MRLCSTSVQAAARSSSLFFTLIQVIALKKHARTLEGMLKNTVKLSK